jgi:hypothetical protein
VNNSSPDAIVESSRVEDIKAFWARNLTHFHIPDTPQDMLYMILRSVKDMSPTSAFDFLESQLKRSNEADQNKLRPLIKNSRLLLIFSELMAIPMFDEIKLVNFHRLDKWRNIVPCWLNVFLNFARDSYRFIAFPTTNPLQSISEVMDKETSMVVYNFDFLDTSFHNIIDNAYKAHLAKVFLSFGDLDGCIGIKDQEEVNWATSFSAYRAEVIEKLSDWAQSPDSRKEYRAHLSVLVERVTYLLDNACQEYQSISKLHVLLPLACNTFIQDLGQDLHQRESAMFEVYSTLFTNFLNISSQHLFSSS